MNLVQTILREREVLNERRVAVARLALISGADAELGQLGPVGFFLAQRLGPAGLLAIGIAWPLTLAASAWLVTLQRFRRADLV